MAAQDGQIIVVSSDKMWPTRGENGKPLQYSFCENPKDSMKRQKEMTPEDNPPRSKGIQHTTEEEQRTIIKSSRKNEVAGTTWKWSSVLNVSGGKSKFQRFKKQYCIGTWNVRSTNQGKLDTVKQEMARVNINILGISELKWMGMGHFNSDDCYFYYCGQESLRKIGVALIVRKEIEMQSLGATSKATE